MQKELFYPYGQRVKKASGTLYWHGVGGEVLAETDLSGNNLHEFIYFAGRRLARREPSGGAYYFYQDHLGTAKVMLNGAGLLRQESTYYPFGGEQRVINNTIDNRYKFAGMERDSETGNDHTWFRSYESNLGRWLSPDPLAGDISNPQSLNRYAYVLNNPTNFIDPLGLTANPADPCYDSYFAMTHAECPTAWPYPGPTIGPDPGGGGGGGGASGGQAGAMPGNAAFPPVEVICSSTGPIGGPLGPPTCTIVITGPGGTKQKLSDLLQWGKNLIGEYLNLVSIAGSINVPISPPTSVAGVSFPGAWQLGTGMSCGGRPWAGTPSARTVGAGPLLFGTLGKTREVLSGPSWSLTIQPTYFIGGQVIWNESGILLGPTAALVPGYALSRTISRVHPMNDWLIRLGFLVFAVVFLLMGVLALVLPDEAYARLLQWWSGISANSELGITPRNRGRVDSLVGWQGW